MTFETVKLEHRNGVDWLTLNRPERLNAITPAMADELADYVDSLGQNRGVRVVVMRGAGRGFCAGLDINARLQQTGSDSARGGGLERLSEIITGMRKVPQPIIAAVHGPACGGGFAFALAADIRVAGRSARMNDAFVKLGISGCELGLSYLLPRLVGAAVAAELMYTGRFIDAERALRCGLVSEVVDDDQLEAAADALAQEMLAISPMALRKTKETFTRCLDLADLEAVIRVEEHTQRQCMRGPDFEEGLSAFAEKRRPIWSGR